MQHKGRKTLKTPKNKMMNLFKKYKNKLRINYNLKQTTLIMIKKRYKKDIYTHNKRF